MHLWAAPAYSMGKQKRSSSVKKSFQPGEAPYYSGPATYNNQKRHSSPSWKMTKASRNSYNSVQTPGPGSYVLKAKSNAKQNGVSFKGRPSSALNTYSTPGPGEYRPNTSMVIRNSPSHKIPKDGRDSSKNSKTNKQPGPTTYQTQTGENWRSGTKFGTEHRLSTNYNSNPGPCLYQFEDKLLKLKKSTPGVKIGTAERIKSIRAQSPGPGSYFVARQFQGESSTKKGFKIPKSSKESLSSTKKVVPGPGTYDMSTKSILKASPAYSISGGPINSMQNYFSTPGPTTYNIPDLDSKFGVSMNKSKKYDSPKNKNCPGPGKYNYQKQFGASAPKYTIPSKYAQKIDTKSPGPANYAPQFNDEHISSPIIKRQKQAHGGYNYDTPGPGFYNLMSMDSISYTIGKEKRDMYKSQDSPGPGQYDFQSTISNLPKYTTLSHTSSKHLN